MNAHSPIPLTAVAPDALLELGTVGAWKDKPLLLDLSKVLAGRLLIQGASGAGKSTLLRRIVEEAFEYVTTILVDPELEFENLADHIGAVTIRAADLTPPGLTEAAARSRRHRLPVHLDLSDHEPDERIAKAAAFFAGLLACPREDWTNTVLVAIDEAHLLAPHVAATSRDAETRRLGVATLTELCARGRKRGIAPVIATQRLAKLASSVVSELQNGLIGLNVLDRDVVRAAEFLGFNRADADQLRRLEPGEFFAIGPALSRRAVLSRVGETVTRHLGATPVLVGPAEGGGDAARQLLDLESLRATPGHARPTGNRRGGHVLDAFLMDAASPAAMRIVEALRVIAPNATTAGQLAGHLGIERGAVDDALDLLAGLAAVETMPRDGDRIARLSAKLRLRSVDVPVVGLGA